MVGIFSFIVPSIEVMARKLKGSHIYSDEIEIAQTQARGAWMGISVQKLGLYCVYQPNSCGQQEDAQLSLWQPLNAA